MPEGSQYFFGPSISGAANELEQAKKFFVDLSLKNRDFAAQEQRRMDQIAAQQAELQRQDIARAQQQENLRQARVLSAIQRAAAQAQQRQLHANNIRSQQQIARERNQSFQTSLSRRLAAEEQAAQLKAVADAQVRQGRDVNAFAGRLFKDRGVRSLDELMAAATTAPGPLSEAQLEEAARGVADTQRRAQEYAGSITEKVDALNQAASSLLASKPPDLKDDEFRKLAEEKFGDPNYRGIIIADYKTRTFKPVLGTAANFPDDAMVYFRPKKSNISLMDQKRIIDKSRAAVLNKENPKSPGDVAKLVRDTYGFEISDYLP